MLFVAFVDEKSKSWNEGQPVAPLLHRQNGDGGRTDENNRPLELVNSDHCRESTDALAQATWTVASAMRDG